MVVIVARQRIAMSVNMPCARDCAVGPLASPRMRICKLARGGGGGAFLCLTLDRNTSISHELGVSAAAGNDVSNMVTQQVASSHCPLQVDAMVWRWVGWGGGVDQISLRELGFRSGHATRVILIWVESLWKPDNGSHSVDTVSLASRFRLLGVCGGGRGNG